MRLIRVEVGLIILLFAFILSRFLFCGADQPYRLVGILEANPHRYLSYVRDALFIILSLSVGLAFSILGYIRERKSPTGILDGWPLLMIIGGFSVFLAVLGLQWTYTSYRDAIRLAQSLNVAGINNLILTVYATASVPYILWMCAGVLFMLFFPSLKWYKPKVTPLEACHRLASSERTEREQTWKGEEEK